MADAVVKSLLDYDCDKITSCEAIHIVDIRDDVLLCIQKALDRACDHRDTQNPISRLTKTKIDAAIENVQLHDPKTRSDKQSRFQRVLFKKGNS